MKNFKSHFKFNKQERSGIFFLLLLILIFQGVYFFLKLNPIRNEPNFRLDEAGQTKIDSLRKLRIEADTVKLFPFNPNYITDYKGYTLGMSTTEIDRLHEFREEGKFVNSAKEFREVTLISDSLLNAISPYFKFPNWVKSNEKKKTEKTKIGYDKLGKVQDLNLATAEDLRRVSGIGEVLSARIVKFRNRLGGFLTNEQLYDVYGLETDVVERALKRFTVSNPPQIDKININTATQQELSSLIYISFDVAQNIVAYRKANGNFKKLDDLLKISGYPQNKNERIKLYLSI